MRLHLIRHPKPMVDQGICYGGTDLAVSQQEVDAVLPSLLANLPNNIPLFSSPLQRCSKLAEAYARTKNIPVSFDARLMEMNFGRWEMCSWDTIPRAEIDAWANDLANYCVGGGGTVLQMAQQVAAFYQERLEQNTDCSVICHAGTIRLMLACQRGLSPVDMANQAAKNTHQISYGEITVLAGNQSYSHG